MLSQRLRNFYEAALKRRFKPSPGWLKRLSVNSTNQLRLWIDIPGAKMLVVLVGLLMAINGLAIWGIIISSREAREEAIQDLQLQALASAKTLESVLASARADFIFLSQSPPIANYEEALVHPDAMVRRWRRIDLEATLLLFLTSHPEVERVSLFTPSGELFMRAGRRAGAPVVLPLEDPVGGFAETESVVGEWPLGSYDQPGILQGVFSVESLLQIAALKQGFRLSMGPTSETGSLADWGDLMVSVPVLDEQWSPPIRWNVEWQDESGGLIGSIGRMSDWYRKTLIFSLSLMVLAGILGGVSLSQLRRRLALEMEASQQQRIREYERQLMHSERLATVGRMAAGLAHEINNPLAGMSNYLAVLEEDLQGSGSEDTTLLVQRIREGLDRAAGITRQVLRLSEPNRLAFAPVELEQVLKESVEFIKNTPLFREIAVSLEAQGQIEIQGNPVSLGQVFLNLLLNAAEVQSGRGSIEIRCRPDNGHAVVSIADSGPGISEDMKDRLFEPFQSGKESTGLGLSICRGIVSQHRGEIEANNRPQGGAVFVLRFPLVSSRETPEDQVGLAS
jgi:signal transduction histidine kinase